MARRMAWIAVRHKVIASQKFGALSGCSAVSLATYLTHNVEKAPNEAPTARIITLDVKGAFDTAYPGRLVRRLPEQGWLNNLVRWVSAFAINRRVRICLEGDTGPLIEANYGLPQSSPVSPILLILYISPLFKMGVKSKSFGCAVDVSILETSSSLHGNCEVLSHLLEEALGWGENEGITFDRASSEI